MSRALAHLVFWTACVLVGACAAYTFLGYGPMGALYTVLSLATAVAAYVMVRMENEATA